MKIPYPYTLKILTSNPMKKAEYEALHLEVVEGDLEEVQGTALEVAIYKALAAPVNTMVEDSVVMIDHEIIVDWKFSYAEHAKDDKEFFWNVTMSHRDEEYVYVYAAKTRFFFVLPDGKTPTTPNFDSYAATFYGEKPLLEDAKKNSNLWACLDPRQKVLNNMEARDFICKVPISIIKEWDGEYQK